jgi:conjugative relaxase-like TrwC/TraI family protein
MMSIGKMSVATAYNYHQKDGYHSGEGQGVYYGKLAGEYGLDGKPIGDEWRNLVRGKSPDGKEAHIDHQRREESEQRGGTDLVFNSNKSSSILIEVYGDTQNKDLADLIKTIRETQHESIYATTDMIEENYIATRTSENGKQRLEFTEEGIFGIFQHHFSREGDPHSHWHVFLLNQTRRKDGTIRAVENNPILKDQRWIGQYQTNLWAAKLEERGIALEYNKDGSFEVAGVPRDLMDHFSRSKKRIDQAVEEMRPKYPLATEAKLREMANLESRPYKNRELTVEDQRRDLWRPDAERMGYTDQTIIEAQKEAQKDRALRGGIQKLESSELLHLAGEVATRNDAVVSRAEILTATAKLGSGMHPEILELAFDEAVKSGELRYMEHAAGYATRENVERSRNTIKQISEGRGTQEPIMTQEKSRASIERYRTDNGHKLTSDQKGALEMLLSSRDQFCAVFGFAGVGKTTLFKAFREMDGGNIAGMCFTGRATSELRNASGIETRTIDSFLTSGEKMQRGMKYIIDEFSFVGDRQMHQLVSQAQETGARLIFSGDPGQFKAISAGNPFKLMQGKLDQYFVKDIVRQMDKADREISALFGEGKAIEAVEALINKGAVVEVKDRDELIDRMVDDYFARGSNRTALMTPWNQTRVEFNERIHQEAIKRGEIESKGWTVAIRQPVSISPTEQHFANAYQVGQYAFFRSGGTRGQEGKIIEVNQHTQNITLETKRGVQITIDVRQDGEQLSIYDQKQMELNTGEKVVFLKNNRREKWNVNNGQTGTFLRVREDERLIFEINGKERVAPENYTYYDRGWCTTDIKAQGLSENQAMADSPDNTSSLYVMATRHKDKDGFRLYTTDLKEVRAAARNLDEKHSAISDREADQIAREHDGRKGRDRSSGTASTDSISESQERQVPHDGVQKEDQAVQEISGQQECRETIKERSKDTGKAREIEMEK